MLMVDLDQTLIHTTEQHCQQMSNKVSASWGWSQGLCCRARVPELVPTGDHSRLPGHSARPSPEPRVAGSLGVSMVWNLEDPRPRGRWTAKEGQSWCGQRWCWASKDS